MTNLNLGDYELLSLLDFYDLEAAKAYLLPHLHKEVLTPRTQLISLGEAVNTIYLIESGVLTAEKYTAEGRKIIGHIFTSKELYGCLEILSGTEVASFIVVEKKATVYTLPGEIFTGLMKKLTPFKDAVLTYFVKKSEHHILHYYLHKYKKARQQIALFLVQRLAAMQDKRSFTFEVTMEILASYLGITRSVLSKELHSLQSEGIITLKKNEIIILNFDLLKAIAEE